MRWMGWLTLSVLVGCGGKSDDVKNAMAAAGAVAGGQLQETVEDAEKFRQDRIARGDTVAMSYEELKAYLPESVDGLEAEGDPKGESQAMPGFSMSTTRRTWKGPGKDGGQAEVEVTITDFGGTAQAYGLVAAPMFMGFSREDDSQKVGSVKMDLAHTGGWQELDKKNGDAKFAAVTRYRYMITAEADGFGEDKTDLLRSVVEDVAKKLKDK
jgi:hypothetical protein